MKITRICARTVPRPSSIRNARVSYGPPEYLRMLDVLTKAGWSSRRCIPHGGHQFSLHLAAGLQLGGNMATTFR